MSLQIEHIQDSADSRQQQHEEILKSINMISSNEKLFKSRLDSIEKHEQKLEKTTSNLYKKISELTAGIASRDQVFDLIREKLL